MCGIAGYLGSKPLSEGSLVRAAQTMYQRGPDMIGQKSFCVKDSSHFVHLVHSRLSIIDLDPRANQPFQLGDKWLIYNGELYNYLELREELEAIGCKFYTKSDTEVLINVLDRWGTVGLDKCEGMWSFALYDVNTREISLCRDRFGEKPLYYYQNTKGAVFFASEIKTIKALCEEDFSLNIDHLYRFLVNGYKSVFKLRENFFNGIKIVPPGQMLTFGPDKIQRRTNYWLPEYFTDNEISYEDAIKGARDRLIRSVELRLRADVPLAFCMSGGVDSNSLISIARRELGFDVHGFTIMNTDKRYEESELVELVRNELNINHNAISLETKNFLPRLRELIRYHDAPVYTITFYVHWLLQKAMSEQGFKISISGTAADEIYSGYFDHHNFYLYDIKNEDKLFKESVLNWRREIGPIVRNPYLQDPELFLKSPFERSHVYLDAINFRDFLISDWVEPFSENIFRNDSLLKNRMLNEIFHETTPVILHEEDMNSMYYSIENRSPFLDRDLFEFCNRIPAKYKVKNGAAKSILRESMRGIVPCPILDNTRKVGFNAPISDLLDLDDPEIRDELLSDSPIYEHVKREKIEKLIQNRDMPNSKSKFLFSFLSSKIFLEENFS